jgi:hypothetical protein
VLGGKGLRQLCLVSANCDHLRAWRCTDSLGVHGTEEPGAQNPNSEHAMAPSQRLIGVRLARSD